MAYDWEKTCKAALDGQNVGKAAKAVLDRLDKMGHEVEKLAKQGKLDNDLVTLMREAMALQDTLNTVMDAAGSAGNRYLMDRLAENAMSRATEMCSKLYATACKSDTIIMAEAAESALFRERRGFITTEQAQESVIDALGTQNAMAISAMAGCVAKYSNTGQGHVDRIQQWVDKELGIPGGKTAEFMKQADTRVLEVKGLRQDMAYFAGKVNLPSPRHGHPSNVRDEMAISTEAADQAMVEAIASVIRLAERLTDHGTRDLTEYSHNLLNRGAGAIIAVHGLQNEFNNQKSNPGQFIANQEMCAAIEDFSNSLQASDQARAATVEAFEKGRSSLKR